MGYVNRHYSKRLAFPSECGGCGRPLRRNSKNKTGYLCRKCRASYKFDAENKYTCHHCPFEMDCTARVQLGLWVRCETPDIGDLERLKFTGGLDEEKVRTEVDASLAGRGSRKVLEEAVSQGAQAIYQSYSRGRQRQRTNPFGERG